MNCGADDGAVEGSACGICMLGIKGAAGGLAMHVGASQQGAGHGAGHGAGQQPVQKLGPQQFGCWQQPQPTGQQPVQHRLPQQTGVNALYCRQQITEQQRICLQPQQPQPQQPRACTTDGKSTPTTDRHIRPIINFRIFMGVTVL